MEAYRKCFICNNDSKNSNKIIVRIREDLREQWCREANIEYFKVYTQFCCEDHFDPKQDLQNHYFKAENREPRFKPSAKLRNIPINIVDKMETSNEAVQEVPSGSQRDQSELARLLSVPQPEAQAKKRKYDNILMPATSSLKHNLKVQVAVQASVRMMDKSTNTHFKAKKISSPVKI